MRGTCTTWKRRSSAARSERRAAHRRAQHAPCARSRSVRRCFRESTVQSCSPAARPSRSSPRRWEPARTSNARCAAGRVHRALMMTLPPPFSTGETGHVGSPREIGRRRLAARAGGAAVEGGVRLRCAWSRDHRVNGSSSMATVCGGLRDGCGAFRSRVTSRDRDGPHQGRRALRGAHRHLGDEDHLGAWTSVRAPIAASPRCRWTSRSGHHARS